MHRGSGRQLAGPYSAKGVVSSLYPPCTAHWPLAHALLHCRDQEIVYQVEGVILFAQRAITLSSRTIRRTRHKILPHEFAGVCGRVLPLVNPGFSLPSPSPCGFGQY